MKEFIQRLPYFITNSEIRTWFSNRCMFITEDFAERILTHKLDNDPTLIKEVEDIIKSSDNKLHNIDRKARKDIIIKYFDKDFAALISKYDYYFHGRTEISYPIYGQIAHVTDKSILYRFDYKLYLFNMDTLDRHLVHNTILDPIPYNEDLIILYNNTMTLMDKLGNIKRTMEFALIIHRFKDIQGDQIVLNFTRGYIIIFDLKEWKIIKEINMNLFFYIKGLKILNPTTLLVVNANGELFKWNIKEDKPINLDLPLISNLQVLKSNVAILYFRQLSPSCVSLWNGEKLFELDNGYKDFQLFNEELIVGSNNPFIKFYNLKGETIYTITTHYPPFVLMKYGFLLDNTLIYKGFEDLKIQDIEDNEENSYPIITTPVENIKRLNDGRVVVIGSTDIQILY